MRPIHVFLFGIAIMLIAAGLIVFSHPSELVPGRVPGIGSTGNDVLFSAATLLTMAGAAVSISGATKIEG